MEPLVLVIEDEEILRFTFESFLSKEGYRVETAEGYESALEVISRDKVDLIIADIVLPGRTGLDLLREAKDKGLRCPVIMITGKPSIENAAEAVRLGAYDYLVKPVEKSTLLKVAEQALKFKAVSDEKDRMALEKEQYRTDLEAIFSSVQEGIVTVNSDMCVMKANRAVERICGLVPSEIAGKRFDEIRTPCNPACSKVIHEALETQREVRAARVECSSSERRRRVVELTGSPLRDRSGGFGGAVLVIRDVTRESELERELKERRQFRNIIGKSGKMQEIYELLEDLAGSDTTVLITGESGTGKELAANALHYGGVRAQGPFVKVNCSALSDSLLESELFGHVRGAFTGAVKDKVGRFELAHGGSILLDEIGEVSPRIQLKLLRVIQEKEFERVGEATPIKVDVRIIATTNRDLKQMVEARRFREDLYYRLKVIELSMPPLRERIGDIPLLVEHFCVLFNRRLKKEARGITEEAMKALCEYPWPGNVRELEHAIEHAFVLCHTQMISLRELPPEIRSYCSANEFRSPFDPSLDLQNVLEALRKTGGNKARAARLLGVSRRTIYRRLNKKGRLREDL